MGDRCRGQCCESFSLRYSPHELARAAGDAKREGRLHEQIIQIAEMVLLIGEFDGNPATHNGTPLPTDPPDERQWFYTCTNLTHHGDCSIYDQRPSMCRDYPRYGGSNPRCAFPTCESDDARVFVLPAANLVRHPREARGLREAVAVAQAVVEGGR